MWHWWLAGRLLKRWPSTETNRGLSEVVWSYWGIIITQCKNELRQSLYNIYQYIKWKPRKVERYLYLYYYSLLIYDLQSEDWINTYYMLKGFLKARRPSKVSNEMKCTNEKMRWNTQDTNLSSYVPKANVDHTISG